MLKELVFWEKYRPNTLNPEKGKKPIILLPRIKKIVDSGIKFNMILVGAGGLGKCVCEETLIKVRNKETGEIKEIKIKELLQTKTTNTKKKYFIILIYNNKKYYEFLL